MGGLRIQPAQLIVLVLALVVLVGLGVMYRYTSFGLRLRAVALDPYAAGLAGINIGRTSLGTWSRAGGLTGILVSPLVTFRVDS